MECFIDLSARENLQDAVQSLPLLALQSEGQTALSHSLFQPLPLCCAVVLEISTIWITWLSCLQPAIIKVKAYYLGRRDWINPLAASSALAWVSVSQKLGLEGGSQGCPGARGLGMWNCWWGRKGRPRAAPAVRAGGAQDPGKQLGQGSANGEEENVLEADLPYFYSFA